MISTLRVSVILGKSHFGLLPASCRHRDGRKGETMTWKGLAGLALGLAWVGVTAVERGAGVDLPVWALAVGALLTVAVVLLTSGPPLGRGGRSSPRLAIVSFLAVALSAPDAPAR